MASLHRGRVVAIGVGPVIAAIRTSATISNALARSLSVLVLAALGCSTEAGAGGASASSGAGGEAPCVPSACPQPASDCEVPTCTLGACAFSPKPSGTPCGAASGTSTRVCGAPSGPAAGTCVGCNASSDCASSVCAANECAPATCEDHQKNGDETGVDCGGACAPCANGAACASPDDCVSGVCKNTACESPCKPPGVVPSAVPGCTNIAAQAVLSANGELEPAAWAVDQDVCTEWNSGAGPPANITFDFGKPRSIGAISLVPNMLPSGAVKHVVEVSADGQTFAAALAIDQEMTTGVIYPFALPANVSARWVRVRTTASPSWVSWDEVAIFDCP